MQTRVYTDKINIDNNSTREFWQKRANNILNQIYCLIINLVQEKKQTLSIGY